MSRLEFLKTKEITSSLEQDVSTVGVLHVWWGRASQVAGHSRRMLQRKANKSREQGTILLRFRMRSRRAWPLPTVGEFCVPGSVSTLLSRRRF